MKENQINLINNISKLTNYRLVAEVVESENCGWNANVGDKIVLRGPGWILPAECTNKENTCLFAVSELTPFSWMLYDRVCSGHDPEDMIFKRVRCKDPELNKVAGTKLYWKFELNWQNKHRGFSWYHNFPLLVIFSIYQQLIGCWISNSGQIFLECLLY